MSDQLNGLEDRICYFHKKDDHTDDVLEIGLSRFQQGGIEKIILASTFGTTALKAAETFEPLGVKLLIVGEILKEGKSPKGEICQQLESKGHRVIWGTTLGEISTLHQGTSRNTVTETFYRLGQGFKVACEIILMADSQGYLDLGQKVLSMAGTHRGADTAIVASAASFSQFEDFKVHEILCKPY